MTFGYSLDYEAITHPFADPLQKVDRFVNITVTFLKRLLYYRLAEVMI